MKTIGILGGIGHESTIIYYKKLVADYLQRNNSFPHIIINSLDLNLVVDMLSKNNLEQLTLFLAKEINALVAAGADFVAIASNTPHIVFDELKTLSHCPLISIVESTANVANHSNLKKIALLGTKYTMQSTFFQTVFSKYGIEIITPNAEDQAYIVDKYSTELIKGITNDSSRLGFINIVNRMVSEYQLDGVIVGCTEFPLIMNEADYSTIKLLDTVDIHVKRIIDFTAVS